MSDWRTGLLSEVVELRRGFDLPHRARRSGPYPILSAGDTVGWHDEAPVKGPGFAIGRATNLGRPTWTDADFWPLNTTLYAADFHGNVPRWVYHLFEVLDLAGFDSGSVQPMLNRNYISHLPVRIPPRREQSAIAEVLGALDDKIAANLRTEAVSEATISVLYEAALAEGDSAHHPLLDAISVTFGEPFSGTLFSESGAGRPLIRIRDLKTFSPQIWTTETRKSETIVQPGDVVVGMDAEFRATPWLGGVGLLNQRVCLMGSPTFGNALVRELIRAPLMSIEQSKSATTVIHLNKSDLARVSVLVPSKSAIAEFRRQTDALYALRVGLALERAKLGELRDTLLPHLMSGRLRVRDAEKQVGEVV